MDRNQLSTEDRQRRIISGPSATGICVASMIGMGIFTVTGVVGSDLGSTTNLLLAWVIAGVVALAGALTIGELGAMRPKASAQYVIVHESLGPTCGYLNGMITLFIGYIAAIAAIAIVAGVIQAITVIGGKRFNDGLVVLKVLVIVGFIVAGLFMSVEPMIPDAALIEAARTMLPDSALGTIPVGAEPAEVLAHLRDAPSPPVFSAAIGLAVITISFAYLGWSTAAEVAGEIHDPGRNLPRSIIGSVVVVGGLYLLMNVVYLRVISPAAMLELDQNGDIVPMANIGAITARHLFGDVGGRLVIGMIVVLFISTLSVSVMTSGRVVAAMSWKGQLPTSWGVLNRRGAPTLAIILMTVGTIPLVWASGLKALLEYVGILTTFAVCLTMLSVMVQRVRAPDLPRPFRIPLYPIPPLLSLGLGIWLIVTSAIEDWIPVLASIATLVVMLVFRPLLNRQGFRN